VQNVVDCQIDLTRKGESVSNKMIPDVETHNGRKSGSAYNASYMCETNRVIRRILATTKTLYVRSPANS